MAGRTTFARMSAVTHAVALTLWIGLLISAGVAAAGAFATLPDLGISLDEYESFDAGDPSAHGRLAAGKMLERVFTAVDFAQVPLAVIVVVSLLFEMILSGGGWRRPAHVIRVGCIALACGLLAIHIAFIAPPMNRELRAYWSAAAAGNTTEAMARRDRFDEYHPRAELILKSNLILLLIATGSAALLRTCATSAVKEDGLETPLLARRRI
jgi:hypothetical protein